MTRRHYVMLHRPFGIERWTQFTVVQAATRKAALAQIPMNPPFDEGQFLAVPLSAWRIMQRGEPSDLPEIPPDYWETAQ